MGQQRSAWLDRLYKLLADGEWHDLDVVVRDAMRLVPPGKAFRHAERQRQMDSPGPRRRGTEEDAIRSGQRSIVMQTVIKAQRYGRFERKKEGGVRMIRVPSSGTPETWSTDDELAEELRRQAETWMKVMEALGKDAIVAAAEHNPLESLDRALTATDRRGYWPKRTAQSRGLL